MMAGTARYEETLSLFFSEEREGEFKIENN